MIEKSRILFDVGMIRFSDGDSNIDIAFETLVDSLVANLILWRYENSILKTFDEEMSKWWSKTQSIMQWSFKFDIAITRKFIIWYNLIDSAGLESQALNLIWTSCLWYDFRMSFFIKCHLYKIEWGHQRRQWDLSTTWYIFEHCLCRY